MVRSASTLWSLAWIRVLTEVSRGKAVPALDTTPTPSLRSSIDAAASMRISSERDFYRLLERTIRVYTIATTPWPPPRPAGPECPSEFGI